MKARFLRRELPRLPIEKHKPAAPPQDPGWHELRAIFLELARASKDTKKS